MDHHGIELPHNPEMALWRYMDLSKFVALLQSGALYFARADMLGDDFEGSLPVANAKTYRDLVGEQLGRSGVGDEGLANINLADVEMRRKMREEMFVSCWHGNEYESAAMWRLYAQSGDAVAIKTTFAKLTEVLPDGVILGNVRYVDYARHTVPVDSLIAPFMIKRTSFAHENEVRAAFWFALRELIPESITFKGAGALCPVDLHKLIEAIHVSPTSPPWFLEIVTGLADQYGLAVKPSQSALSASALF